MKNLPKTFFFICIFLLTLGLAFPWLSRPAWATASQTYLGQINDLMRPNFDDKAFNLNQMYGTVDSATQMILGVSQLHPEANQVAGGGAVAFVGQAIGVLYTPPASTSEYLAYLKNNLGLATPVYAQGAGFAGLTPLLNIWRAMRNAAYLVFILFFVITGLLIMFRVKVSPQAVATVQNALPRLVITLILITLSYAIVGLLVDLMYVLMFLFFNLFRSALPANFPSLESSFGENVMRLFWGIGGGWGVINNAARMVNEVVSEVTGGIPGFSGLLGVGAQGLAWLIFAVAILFALFKLFFILLKAYIWVIVLLIFAPFQLLLGALPGGGNLGISGWIRGLIANLAVFPATMIMFLLAAALSYQSQQMTGEAWIAPFLGGSWQAGALPALIAFGIILLTPQVVQMMNDAFKPPPFPYGVAIGAALGGGAGYYTGIARGVGGTIASSREAIIMPGGGPPERRGIGRSIAGRIFR